VKECGEQKVKMVLRFHLVLQPGLYLMN